ncbi:hypothetical protein ACQQ2Q_20540 [Agrobacterium sp. ES01]|uniref:hypothetical protein n=1 Tax=Agrobacterium sp. ES01 TaxID=3420714 RepID=UPI003D0A660B
MTKIWYSILLLPLASCASRTPVDVADPQAITLRAAVSDVANSISDLQNLTSGRKKAGMYLDEATIVFNVSSKASATNTLKVSAAGLPIAGGTLGINPEATLQNDGERGNQITLKFKNVATLNKPNAGTVLFNVSGVQK